MNTKQVNLKTHDPYDVYCGRGNRGLIPLTPKEYGWLGNPIKRFSKCPECDKIHETNGSTLACYEVYLRDRLEKDIPFSQAFDELYGKTLACFCPPAPCHTDIIIKLLAERNHKSN